MAGSADRFRVGRTGFGGNQHARYDDRGGLRSVRTAAKRAAAETIGLGATARAFVSLFADGPIQPTFSVGTLPGNRLDRLSLRFSLGTQFRTGGWKGPPEKPGDLKLALAGLRPGFLLAGAGVCTI